jgi:hypothetical protein
VAHSGRRSRIYHSLAEVQRFDYADRFLVRLVGTKRSHSSQLTKAANVSRNGVSNNDTRQTWGRQDYLRILDNVLLHQIYSGLYGLDQLRVSTSQLRRKQPQVSIPSAVSSLPINRLNVIFRLITMLGPVLSSGAACQLSTPSALILVTFSLSARSSITMI